MTNLRKYALFVLIQTLLVLAVLAYLRLGFDGLVLSVVLGGGGGLFGYGLRTLARRAHREHD